MWNDHQYNPPQVPFPPSGPLGFIGDEYICFAQEIINITLQKIRKLSCLASSGGQLSSKWLIQVLLKSSCKKLVFTSSGGTIFGEPSVIPTAEGDYADEPESPYGVAKKRLNELIKIMTKNSNLKYSILNLSNVYGPRQDPHGEAGVVSIFANKYLNDEEPIIFGDGEQTRDYIYVKDVVSALIKASTIDENHFLNIGTGVETSVNELANSMKSQFNSEINPIYKPAREGELNRSVLNNTKAKKELDWKPEYDLDEGMKQVFNWLKA